MEREQSLNRKTEVRKKIDDLIKKTKGNYITQGVSFNKTCPRQMKLLEEALLESASFSGLVKELFAIRYDKTNSTNIKSKPEDNSKENIYELDFINKDEIENNWL